MGIRRGFANRDGGRCRFDYQAKEISGQQMRHLLRRDRPWLSHIRSSLIGRGFLRSLLACEPRSANYTVIWFDLSLLVGGHPYKEPTIQENPRVSMIRRTALASR